MKKLYKLFAAIILVVSCIFGYTTISSSNEINNEIVDINISEDKEYSSKDEVALYIHLYNHLPSNYITKTKAKKLGWVAEQENLWDVAYGKSIGGGPFQNLEEILPTDKKYKECDVDYDGTSRNSKRLVYSDDGYIYYTEDHYETFILLYEPE